MGFSFIRFAKAILQLLLIACLSSFILSLYSSKVLSDSILLNLTCTPFFVSTKFTAFTHITPVVECSSVSCECRCESLLDQIHNLHPNHISEQTLQSPWLVTQLLHLFYLHLDHVSIIVVASHVHLTITFSQWPHQIVDCKVISKDWRTEERYRDMKEHIQWI